MLHERIAEATGPELALYLERHGEAVTAEQAGEISRSVSEFLTANLETWTRAGMTFESVLRLAVAHGMGVIVRVLGLSLNPSPRTLN